MNSISKIVSSILACCILVASMPVNVLAVSTEGSTQKQESVDAASSIDRCGSYVLPPIVSEDATDTNAKSTASLDLSNQIIGTWGNDAAVSQDSLLLWAVAYNTTFSADKRISQTGYRNRDAGLYRVVDEKTVVAQFSYNLYDSPGYGYQQIKDYTYSITYTYNAEEDTLYADYSKEFEEAIHSNAVDGTLHRISTYGTMSDWVPKTFPDIGDGTPVSGSLSDDQLAQIKQALGVPRILDVQVSVSNRSYWDAGERWLIQVSFYHNGEMVAGASVDADTLELCRNIMVYSGDAPSDWAEEEIENARAAGIIPESLDSQYQDNITREEFCEIGVSLVESKTGETMENILTQKGVTPGNPFSDTTNEAVAAMNALGIVNGTGAGKFSPYDEITREEAATMLTRLAKAMNLSGPGSISLSFADADLIANWAYYGVGFVSSCQDDTNGNFVMGGTGQNRFSPDNSYTREQAIASFLRLYHAIGPCTADQIRIDTPQDISKLDIVSFQGYTNRAIPMEGAMPLIALKIPERAKTANDGIFVLENGDRMDTDEYEVWLKPYGNEPIPAKITDGFRIEAYQPGYAILTVQSKVTGTVWESFYLFIADNDDRLLLDLSMPVQTIDTALYGEQAFNFANCGIYVEDYTVEIQPDGDRYITLIAYNTNAIDGAFDIYDKDGNYLRSKRIDKRDILPSTPWEAVTNLFMIGYDIGSGNALTYRQNDQSTRTEIEFEVPAGGLVVMSNNTATSPGAMSYNLSSFILDSANAAKNLATWSKDQKKLLNDSLAKAIQDSLKELGNTVSIQKAIAGGMKDVAQNVTAENALSSANDIVSGWLNTLSSAGVDWEQLLYDVEDDLNGYLVNLAPNTVTGLIENAGGPAGAVLKYMFTLSNLVEPLPQIVQMCSATECDSVYILARQDLPWN